MSLSYQSLGRALERELLIHRVPEQARKVADAIKLLSYDLGRDAAPVDDPADLYAAVHLDRGDFERAVKLLVGLKILQVLRGGDRFWYELLPLPDEWPDMPAGRKTRKKGHTGASPEYSSRAPSWDALEKSRDAWQRLERGATTEPDQRELPMPLTPAQRSRDGGAAELAADRNRQAAAAREERREEPCARVWEIPTEPTLSELVRDSIVGISHKPGTQSVGNSHGLQPPARTRARHDHVPTSVPQSMVHEHGHARGLAEEENALRAMDDEQLEARLDEDARFQLTRLEGLPGVRPATYHRTWLLRLNDRWRRVALRALAECSSMHARGEQPTKGWGQAANYFFNLWKYDEKAAERAVSQSNTRE